jgi:hypothetical protein
VERFLTVVDLGCQVHRHDAGSCLQERVTPRGCDHIVKGEGVTQIHDDS